MKDQVDRLLENPNTIVHVRDEIVDTLWCNRMDMVPEHKK